MSEITNNKVELEIGKPWYEGVSDLNYLAVRNNEIKEKIKEKKPLNFVDTMIHVHMQRQVPLMKKLFKDFSGVEPFLEEAFSLTKLVPNFAKRTDLVVDTASYDDQDAMNSWKQVHLADWGLKTNVLETAKEALSEESIRDKNNKESLDSTLEIIDNIISENNQ